MCTKDGAFVDGDRLLTFAFKRFDKKIEYWALSLDRDLNVRGSYLVQTIYTTRRAADFHQRLGAVTWRNLVVLALGINGRCPAQMGVKALRGPDAGSDAPTLDARIVDGARMV